MKYTAWSLLFLLPAIAYSQQQPTPVQRALHRTETVASVPQLGEQLNLKDAIAMALEKDYQIKVAKTQEQIARNNRIPGNAGLLPVLTGNVNSNGSLQNLNQGFLDNIRPRQTANGVFNRTGVFGITGTYTLFNGFSNFITYEQLGDLVKISEVTTRLNIETTIAGVATAYYDVVRQLQQILALRQALNISRERLELAKANYEVGTRSKVDFLSAQVDYNADSSALVSQEQTLRNAKILLNSLIVRDPSTEFAVRDTILVKTDLAADQLPQPLFENTPLLLNATLNRRVADRNTQIARASRLPTVNLQTAYNYTRIDNQGGFGIGNARNTGLTYNIQAAIPIFNGGNIKRVIANAKASELIAEYQEADQKVLLQQAFDQTYTQYRNSLTLLNLEVQNYQIAIQNIDIAYERYRVGNSTAVEFRDVQRNAVAAQARLINAEFTAKAAEIELLRLSSTIAQGL